MSARDSEVVAGRRTEDGVPIVIFTRLVARPGRRDDVLEAFAPFLAAVEGEPGTELFATHIARDDADVLLCYEVYRDADALAAHRDSDAVRDLVARLGDLLAGPPEVVYASRVGSISAST